jgi:hypothetical protein
MSMPRRIAGVVGIFSLIFATSAIDGQQPEDCFAKVLLANCQASETVVLFSAELESRLQTWRSKHRGIMCWKTIHVECEYITLQQQYEATIDVGYEKPAIYGYRHRDRVEQKATFTHQTAKLEGCRAAQKVAVHLNFQFKLSKRENELYKKIALDLIKEEIRCEE